MRISKQISGNRSMRDEGENQGRGEYEWCDLTTADPLQSELVDRRILIELPDGIVIDTDCVLELKHGKNRVRTAPDATVKRKIYPHYHIAAALLMPCPSRTETNWGGGMPIMRNEEYGIQDLFPAGPVRLGPNHSVFAVFDRLQIANNSNREYIDISTRFADVQRVWRGRSELEATLSGLLDEHEQLVRAGRLISIEGGVIVSELQAEAAARSEEYDLVGHSRIEDPLPTLLQMLGLRAEEMETPLLEIPVELPEIRRRELARRRQRLAIARDFDSVRFRRNVREAYGFRCTICELRLPPLSPGSKPGVDSAHILPDSEFDLNHVTNGLCLCKLHHWAFDEGLIEIRFNEPATGDLESTGYSIVVPDEAVSRAAQGTFGGIDLSFLHPVVRPIPRGLLPSDPRYWPDPKCLQRLRELLYS